MLCYARLPLHNSCLLRVQSKYERPSLGIVLLGRASAQHFHQRVNGWRSNYQRVKGKRPWLLVSSASACKVQARQGSLTPLRVLNTFKTQKCLRHSVVSCKHISPNFQFVMFNVYINFVGAQSAQCLITEFPVF